METDKETERSVFEINRSVRHKATRQLLKIVDVGPDWLDCVKKAGRKKLKRRFTYDEVEVYTSVGVVGRTITAKG